MRKVSLLVCMLCLAACRLDVAPIVVEWNHDPGALILEADTRGGGLPHAVALNHIPDARVWGDGRIVWVEFKDDGSSVVWEGYLTEKALANLLRFTVEEGFFGWEDHYEPANPPADLLSSHITVNMTDRSKTVSQYFDAAPAGFWRIYERVPLEVADALQLVPQRGLLRAWLRDDAIDTTDAIPWSADADLTLSELVTDGRWIEGPRIALVWNNLRQHGDAALFREGEDVYNLSLQVPGLSLEEPR